jgi:transposase InsO family protein
VHAAVTRSPTNEWVAQQLREATPWGERLKYLIRDRDGKYGKWFAAVAGGIEILETTVRAPRANSYAERWVRTAREECLDHILILNETHLWRGLGEFINDYYNVARPHQGIEQQTPIPYGQPQNTGTVQCRKMLGGIINDYYRNPASSSIYLS